jgi:hypothetical protein
MNFMVDLILPLVISNFKHINLQLQITQYPFILNSLAPFQTLTNSKMASIKVL